MDCINDGANLFHERLCDRSQVSQNGEVGGVTAHGAVVASLFDHLALFEVNSNLSSKPFSLTNGVPQMVSLAELVVGLVADGACKKSSG